MGTKSRASGIVVKYPLKWSGGVQTQKRTPVTNRGKKGAKRRVESKDAEKHGGPLRPGPLVAYVLLAFLFSWGAWVPLMVHRISFASMLWNLTYVVGLSGPLAASVLVSFAVGGRSAVETLLKRGLIWKVKGCWYLVSLALPPALMLGGWCLATVLGEKHSLWEMPSLGLLPLTFLIMALRGGPLNEEYGWRGFLLPQLLEQFSPFWASVILTPIWLLWHVPLWFIPGLPHKHWPFGLFGMLVAPITFLFTWLYRRTKGSVLISILFHASFNTAIHYLPVLPPRHPSLVPFEMWVALTWVVTGIIIATNSRAWFARPLHKPKALLGAGVPGLVVHR